jgi:TatA/E family protein of Tat protein translocase
LLSPVDVLIIGAVALVVFGPDQLPKVARRAGQVVREVQNTSASFIREMERAADDSDYHAAAAPVAPENVAGEAEP